MATTAYSKIYWLEHKERITQNICNGVKGNLLTKEDMKIIGKQIIKPKWLKSQS